jgi:hypothetical protein
LSLDLDKIRKRILEKIDIEEFYAEYGLSVGKNNKCVFHKDDNPSLKVNDDGSCKCFGCDIFLHDPIAFYKKLNNLQLSDALIQLYGKYVTKLIDVGYVQKLFNNLDKDEEIRKRLKKERGWNKRVLNRYRIGYEDGRLFIPVEDEYGFVTTGIFYNVFGNNGTPKFQTLENGMSPNVLYPIDVTRSAQKIYLVEGFSDVLCALSQGLSAVTTGKAGSWRDSYFEYFMNKDVIIVPDQDEAGIKGAEKLANVLVGKANTIKIINLKFNGVGKDLTDWFNEGNTVAKILELARDAEYYALPTPVKLVLNELKDDDIREVEFHEITKKSNYYKPLMFHADVVSRGDDRFYTPTAIRMTCEDNKGLYKNKCPLCPLNSTGTKDVYIEKTSKHFLRLTECSYDSQMKSVREIFKVGKACHVDFDVLKNESVETVVISKPIVPGKLDHESISLVAYYIGSGLTLNKPYVFSGCPVPHPRRNNIVVLLHESKPVLDSVHNFKLTDEITKNIEMFQTHDVEHKLLDIYIIRNM